MGQYSTRQYLTWFLALQVVGLGACAANTPDMDAGMWWADAASDAAGDAASDASADAGVADALVINEVHAVGDDWVELFNAGTRPVSLDGVRLADSDATGHPQLSEAVDLGSAGRLDPGAYLVILANLGSSANPGVQTDCGAIDVATCLESSFGISDSRGDLLFLLDGSGAILSRVDYPPHTTDATQSYGRLPDGTGPFLIIVPSPGAANMR